MNGRTTMRKASASPAPMVCAASTRLRSIARKPTDSSAIGTPSRLTAWLSTTFSIRPTWPTTPQKAENISAVTMPGSRNRPDPTPASQPAVFDW